MKELDCSERDLYYQELPFINCKNRPVTPGRRREAQEEDLASLQARLREEKENYAALGVEHARSLSEMIDRDEQIDSLREVGRPVLGLFLCSYTHSRSPSHSLLVVV
jgi:hypothetical protein